MNKILVRGEPTGPFQYIYIFQEDQVIEKIGVPFNDIEDIVLDFINKYQINTIHLSGNKNYMKGIEKKITEVGSVIYGMNDLVFKYV